MEEDQVMATVIMTIGILTILKIGMAKNGSVTMTKISPSYLGYWCCRMFLSIDDDDGDVDP